MKAVLEVPVRKKGKTGSGAIGGCHVNVAKLQLKTGGMSALGYMIELNNALNGYEFTSHSTWLTPQKTLVDVTLNWKGYDSIMFSPVEIFDAATECWHGSFNFFLTKNYKKAGLIRAADQFESERIEFSSHLRKENYLLFQDQPFDIEAFG